MAGWSPIIHAPLARDVDLNWFAQQLGEGWRSEEPGIYRFVEPESRNIDEPSRAADDEVLERKTRAAGPEVLKAKLGKKQPR